MSTAAAATPDNHHAKSLPPVLGRLLRGTFWLALRTPLQVVFTFWSVRLITDAVGKPVYGAYNFAWGYGFLQFLLEFGMSSALQRQVSDAWTRGDRAGVDRAIACGTIFYAAMAGVQVAALLSVAYFALPHSRFVPGTPSYVLIVKLLWLQAVTAPCFGLSTVASAVLQAARRYDFIPRCELATVVARAAILVAGLAAGADFFRVVAAMTVVQVGLTLVPAYYVMVRKLGHVPHFAGARWADFRSLTSVSFFVFLIQLSVVLADKVDTTILGFAAAEPGAANATYKFISTPFLQIRQTGWMLAYLVMPAVASLAAARDEGALEKVKYDGPRLLVGLLLPVALLAWIYAAPFLAAWVGPDTAADAPLMRLFLVATLPLLLSVQVQMAIGMGKIRVIAWSALAGSLVNLPLSYYLTTRLGVAGVVWGTVLTTLFSNLLAPGIYVFRVLEIRPAEFLRRTLGAPLLGASALVAATWACRAVFSAEPVGVAASHPLLRAGPLLVHLTVGSLAYLAGYLLAPPGRGDFATLARKLLRRGPAAGDAPGS